MQGARACSDVGSAACAVGIARIARLPGSGLAGPQPGSRSWCRARRAGKPVQGSVGRLPGAAGVARSAGGRRGQPQAGARGMAGAPGAVLA
jgi:hypothetical protein